MTENKSLNDILKRIDYNAHDMGELGKFIRVDYAKEITTTAIREIEQECSDALRQMNETYNQQREIDRKEAQEAVINEIPDEISRWNPDANDYEENGNGIHLKQQLRDKFLNREQP